MLHRPPRPRADRTVMCSVPVAVLVVLAALSVVACSSSSKSNAGTSTSTAGRSVHDDRGRGAPTRGPLLLAASNTTPAFTFLAPDFIAHHHPVRFTYGASSVLEVTANTPSNPAVLFASADEANVNKLIAVADKTVGSPGTCSTTCTGVGSTKVQYTVGRLVVFSCKAGGRTLAPAQGAPGCAAPAGGYLAKPPKTAADVVALLEAHSSFKLAIADPGTVPPGSAPPTAPYGLAAYQALTSTAPGGGGLTLAKYNAFVASGQIVKGANVTATQTYVVTGAAQMAMLPRSFVVSPKGDDTDSWTAIASTLHRPIAQWAVILNKPGNANYASDEATAHDFLTYLLSGQGQAVLASFGYEALH